VKRVRVALVTSLLGLACAQDPSSSQADGALVAPGGAGTAVLSVRDYGARGDGASLDTAAIQSAVDAVPAGGTLRFPPGTYRIESDRGIRLKSDMRLDLGEATLVGANVDGGRCRLLEIQGARNIVITGGTLVGSRGGQPDWGVGLLASDAEDLRIEKTVFRDFFFDGILLTGNAGCKRVTVLGVTAENNRRTGLAIVSADGVTVEDSTFTGSHGQSPEAGLNCEPGPGASVHRLTFRRSTFMGNAGVGLYVQIGRGVMTEEVSVEGGRVEGNEQGIVASGVSGVSITDVSVSGHRKHARSGIALGDGTVRAVVARNHLEDNFRGIVSAGASEVEIRDNVVTGTGAEQGFGKGEDGDGIVCRGLKAMVTAACVVSSNTISRTAGSGIVAALVSKVRIVDNTVEDAGQRGIHVRSTTESVVSGNHVTRIGLEAPGRYDGIELTQSANANVVTSNVCRLGGGMRNAIGIGPGCVGNQVESNTVLP
jgi:nitrous oxidase accessory protein NosD